MDDPEVGNFDQFWQRFCEVVMSNEVVTYSTIHAGMQEKQREAVLWRQREELRQKKEDERCEREAKENAALEEQTKVHDLAIENEDIKDILDNNKSLTGDDVRPGDPGYEFEVPPRGDHVVLIDRLLRSVGLGPRQDEAKKLPELGSTEA